MRNLCDNIVKNYCENNKDILKASENRNIRFTQCHVKDVELVKPTRCNILKNLYSTSPKPAPNNVLLVMDDGLYLLSNTDHTDKSLKWKPICKDDKKVYKEVQRSILFESSMSRIGLGTPETPVPSHVRELCFENFLPKVCNDGVSINPEYRSGSVQAEVEKHDGGNVKQGNGDEEEGESSTAQGEKSSYEKLKNIISISIKGKKPNLNFNIASIKIERNEASVDCDRKDEAPFSISDEDFSTILAILNKAKNNSSAKLPTEDQARKNTEENRNLGAIPKRSKEKRKKDEDETKEDAINITKSSETKYHLDPPFQFKPGLSMYSPFQTFGYNTSTILPLSLSQVKIPIVEKQLMDLEGLDQIGSGGYSNVYTARHILRPSLVCIKEFNMAKMDRFDVFMEAKILSYLKSTCCVPECYGLMESTSNPNHLALVQEYFGDGVTLKKVLIEFPTIFNCRQWINLCLQLLIGLHKINKSYVIINDVKSDNILVDITHVIGEDPDNCIRYIDFGRSTFRQGISYLWDPECMRQFRHLAPEVKNGSFTTPGSDLFSLGCVLKAVCIHAGIISMDPIAGMCMRPDPSQRPATLEVIEMVRAIYDSLD